MVKQSLMISALTCSLFALSGNLYAAEGETVYGRQLMSQQEMNEYQTQMRAAKTQEERNQIQNEHHQQMQERAKEQGVTIPNQPQNMGPGNNGMGPGNGMGSGMRPGGGMGSGSGMGPGSNR